MLYVNISKISVADIWFFARCVDEGSSINGDKDGDRDADAAMYILNQQTRNIALQNEGGFIYMRKSPKVIRYCGYRLVQDAQNYYRELLMLYHSWRDEQTDIMQLVDFEQEFLNHSDEILLNRREYCSVDDAALLVALENVEV